MRVEVTIDGNTYKSKEDVSEAYTRFANRMYENFESFTKLKLILEDNSILILGRDAAQRAQIVIYP